MSEYLFFLSNQSLSVITPIVITIEELIPPSTLILRKYYFFNEIVMFSIFVVIFSFSMNQVNGMGDRNLITNSNF